MSPTKIEWSDETWNPVVGCSHVSAGCDGCYAARDAFGRLNRLPLYAGLAHRKPDELPRFTGEVRLVPDRLDQPLRWKRPRRIFVNSMSDLFHEDIPTEFLDQVWSVMVRSPQHSFQVLTKRPQRMARALGPNGIGFYAVERPVPCPQPNIWLGTSVETQAYANIRIPHLLATPAAVRFLSVEPLLGPVDLSPWLACEHDSMSGGIATGLWTCDGCGSLVRHTPGPAGIGVFETVEKRGIGWVIVGGESGPQARRMDPEWALALIEQCEAAGVPVFVKQAGSVLAREWGCAHRAGAKIEEWPPEFRAQEYPA